MSLLLHTVAFAQTAPAAAPSSAAQSTAVAPAAPVQALPKAPAETFPPINPKNFTAKSPAVETVNSFLHALWGYDESRSWSVAAIEPTTAPGVVRVQVYFAEKSQPGRIGQTILYVTPDGQHAIAGEVVSFGAKPFSEIRTLLQAQANGPARGAAGKDLELVEFADLQCPNCKTAQGTMDQLARDFPQARIVYENLPLTAVHPYSSQAAAVGHCVRQAKGDAAFFTYAQKVYDTQTDLTAAKVDATLQAAATAAGADPTAVKACASAPATADAVSAVSRLAADIGVSNTPTLVINGRPVPLTQVPYDVLKRVIVFQGSLDGVTVHEQPSLTTLK